MYTTALDIDGTREEKFRDFSCAMGRVRIQETHDCIAVLLTQGSTWQQCIFQKNGQMAGDCIGSTCDGTEEHALLCKLLRDTITPP